MSLSKITFRDYQSNIIDQAVGCLIKNNFVYLAMEVRTGKTLTSLGVAEKLFMNNVLFITKKKAISSIEKDYKSLSPEYKLIVVNYESLHKIPDLKWDMIICDEAHSLGAFPKPNKRAKAVKDIIFKTRAKVMLLSGTPTPESYSQLYHQVYGIPSNPFNDCVNFYKFAHRYVKIKEKKINGLFIRDYSGGSDLILDKMKPHTISFSQKEAGFKTKISEQVLYVTMSDLTYEVTTKLKKDRVVEGEEEIVLADTPVKLMTKLHQLYSGTVKFESGNNMVLDYSKAQFIKEHFKNKKIAIFYKFKAELDALKIIFGEDLTTELKEFKETDKNIALQIVSGREGISLKEADHIVYYNIDFSATSYWQSRDRMTTKSRSHNSVYWVFCKNGIEDDIYKAVTKKKDYTVRHFKKDLLSL
ncbi:MAG: hypothetical protein Unbinned1524contig1000_65 [Prokaryotic dsDNA virus sp.]|nr:MAG: hypothetical protein Unbinned1524contig1000_65 [Prokaryotic dsDNA virus sp.]|tara:strand:- start:1411 stop:2655 length:1245 start_codon:yes stop_codon:yes gene_type:complete